MARPSAYTPELAEIICARLAGGESLKSIGQEEAMPSERSVYRWLANPENVEFRQKYACARESQAEAFLEEIIEIADNATDDVQLLGLDNSESDDGRAVIKHSAIQRARLQVDTRKWAMSKLAAKKYGDKTVVAGDKENPLQIEGNINLSPSESYLQMLNGKP